MKGAKTNYTDLSKQQSEIRSDLEKKIRKIVGNDEHIHIDVDMRNYKIYAQTKGISIFSGKTWSFEYNLLMNQIILHSMDNKTIIQLIQVIDEWYHGTGKEEETK